MSTELSLGQKQRLFPVYVVTLIQYIYSQGYEVTWGDAFRDPRVFGRVGERKGYGESMSCHKLKLAVDLNLFKDGKYLTKTEDHEIFGVFWEKLHPLARWGGRFQDGNHYSFTHNGMS